MDGHLYSTVLQSNSQTIIKEPFRIIYAKVLGCRRNIPRLLPTSISLFLTQLLSSAKVRVKLPKGPELQVISHGQVS